ncbi:MAG: 50S ribosomal protein L29 [Nitrospinae bacterium]|nr:50S ribosomal protein L29 [Nitrospinota bacterium]
MKYSEVLELSDDELGFKEKELRQELFNLRFRKATGQLDNTARIGLLKRDLARVLTSKRERDGAQAAGAEEEGS